MLYRYRLGLTTTIYSLLFHHAIAQPLEEIRVTAQHHSQAIDEVPMGINSFDGELLQQWQIDNIDDLRAVTPGLSGWQQGVSTPIYALRGISSNSFGIGGEASVAVFIDDAYVGRINSTGARMGDIARVEVLKGPQGTLLGRNASAGAIVYHSQLPQPEASLAMTLGAGNFATREATLTGNMPLTQNLAARLHLFYRQQEGDVTNRVYHHHVGGEKSEGGRLSLRFTPANWDINLSMAHQRIDSGGLGYETLNPQLAATGNVAADPYDDELATDIDTYDRIESSDINLRIDTPLSDHWQLRVISAWHHNRSPNLFDVDGSALLLSSAGFTRRNSETLSQEFRFTGSRDHWQWTTGIAYFEEQIDTRIELGYSDINRLAGTVISPSSFGINLPDFALCGALSDSVFGPCQASVTEISEHRGDYQSSGLYGDVSWQIKPQLSLNAGLRYSYDDKHFRYRSTPVNSVTSVLNSLRTAPLNPGGNIIGYSNPQWIELSEQWDAWQPRLAAVYQFNDQYSLYGNLSRGYKAGGFEPSASPALSVYAPEHVNAAEVGLRGRLSPVLRYQVGSYYYENDNYQIQVIDNGIARTINSEGITGSGVEWELQWQLNSEWQLRTMGAYNDSHFEQLKTDIGDYSGNRTILSPRLSAALIIDYQMTTQHWGSVSASWHSEYQSDIFYTAQNSSDQARGDLPLHHLRLSYHAPRDDWQLQLTINNLFDKDYSIFQQDVGAGLVARRGMPRQLSLSFSGGF